jgi:hypothetical protein
LLRFARDVSAVGARLPQRSPSNRHEILEAQGSKAHLRSRSRHSPRDPWLSSSSAGDWGQTTSSRVTPSPSSTKSLPRADAGV